MLAMKVQNRRHKLVSRHIMHYIIITYLVLFIVTVTIIVLYSTANMQLQFLTLKF